MRKTLFIFSLMLASISWSLGQTTITESDFHRLLDYANSKHVMAFINNNDAANKDYFEQYQKKIEPILVAASLDSLDKIISYSTLHNLLSNNKPAQLLAEKKNERKKNYNSYNDDNSLIESLSTPGFNKVDLSNTGQNIIADISNYIKTASKEVSNEIEEIDEVEIIDLAVARPEVESQQPQNKPSKPTSELSEIKEEIHTFRFLFFILYILFVPLLIALIWVIWKTKNIQRKTNEEPQKKQTKKINEPNNEYQLLLAKQREIFKRLEKLEAQKDNNKSIETHHSTLDAENQTQTIVSKEIHFKTKNGKVLQEVLPSSKDSAFKVYNIKNNEAKFKYCGGVVNPDFFDGVCDFENNPADVQTKTKIETISPGIVKKDNKGNWVVETPATIKFL